MPKMQPNDDGTVTFPIKGGRTLTLDEPSMAELAWMHAETERIDKEMTELPPIPAAIDTTTATAEQQQAFTEGLTAYAEASKERTIEIFGGEEQPYGALVVEVVKKLGMYDDGRPVEDITVQDLYGWGASPAVMRTLLEHFRTPLPGKASRPSQ